MSGSPDRTGADPQEARRRRRTLVVVGVVVVAAVVGAAAWWFFGGTAPGEVDIDEAVAQVGGTPQATAPDTGAAAGGADPGGAGSGTEAAGAGGEEQQTTVVDGTWTVDPSVGEFSVTESTGTFVGVRVDEELSNIGATTAVVRTPEVDGTIELDGTTLRSAEVEADFTALQSDRPRRDSAVQRALDTGEFPTASFTLTEPVELDALPAAGEPVSATATGDLTVHGVTNTVDVPLDVAVIDGVAVVTGSFDLALSDYDVQAPSAPIVVSVADTGTVELQLFLTPA